MGWASARRLLGTTRLSGSFKSESTLLELAISTKPLMLAVATPGKMVIDRWVLLLSPAVFRTVRETV